MRIVYCATIGVAFACCSAACCMAQQGGSVPKDVLEQLEFMAGSWDESPGPGGPTSVEQHDRDWAPGKHCLLVTWKGTMDGRKVSASGIMGWNCTRNELKETWYLSNGTWMETHYPVSGMKGETWIGSTTWVGPDGASVKATCQLEKSKDKFVWRASWKDGDATLTYESTATKK